MSRVFGVARIQAKCNGVLVVVPTGDPYFEPHRIKFRTFDCMGETLEHLDFTIGAVTVGGSPQLAVNTLVPDEVCARGSISSRDLDKVNWSTFSTVGLARELQISIYNPHDVDLLIYACLEGDPIPSLDCYVDSWPSYPDAFSQEEKETIPKEEQRKLLKERAEESRARIEEVAEKRYEERVKAKAARYDKWKSGHGSTQQVGSAIVELKPFERRAIRVIPTVSPYLDPCGARYHCSRVSDGADASLVVTGAICGNRVMFGDLFSTEFLNGWMNSFELALGGTDVGAIDEGPYELLEKLKAKIALLEHEGMEGVQRHRRESVKKLRAPEIVGIPSDILQSPKFDDWHEILDFPVFSTVGLARHLHFLVYNPWPFSVRTSITVCGHARSTLEDSEFRGEV